MTQTLVWKEWRENRAIVVAGLGVAIGLPTLLAVVALGSGDVFIADVLEEVAPQIIVTLMWPFFAALFGASAFGSERAASTLDFLVSKPVSRARVWAVKVGTAAVSLALVIAASILLLTLLGVGTGGAFFHTLMAHWQWSMVAVLLLFSSALLVSHTTSQPLAAAAIGAAVAGVSFVAMMGIAGSFYYFIGGGGPLPERFLATPMSLVAALFLIASLLRFAGEELREAIGIGDGAAIFLVVVGISLFAAKAPPAIAQASLAPAWSSVRQVVFSPDGRTAVFAGLSASRNQSQIWWAPATGGRMNRVSSRWLPAYGPTFSPDGSLVAYFTSPGGPRDEAWRGATLWISSPDGADARVLLEGLPATRFAGAKQLAFSADGEKLAVLQHRQLTVVDVAGGDTQTADLTGAIPGTRRADMLGWSSDGREIYVSGIYRGGHHAMAFGLDEGSTRQVARFDHPGGNLDWLEMTSPSLRLNPSADGGPDYLLYSHADNWYEQFVGERFLQAVDVDSGEIHRITNRLCGARAVAIADGAVFYFDCPPAISDDNSAAAPPADGPGSILRRWDFATTTATSIGASPLRAQEMVLDFAGEKLAVAFGASVLGGPATDQRLLADTLTGTSIAVLALDGTVLSSADRLQVRGLGFSRWAPRRFTPDGDLIIAPGRQARFVYRLLDPDTGEIRRIEFFPSGSRGAEDPQ